MEVPEGFKKIDVTLLKGAIGDQATQWWTQEDWDEHNAYVSELKAKGEYLKPVNATFIFKNEPEFDKSGIDFSNIQMMVPLGLGEQLKTPAIRWKSDWENR